MEICIVLFGSSIRKIVSVSLINAMRSISKKAAKSSMRYAGRMASPCRTLLSCEWSLLMPVASCRTLIQRSLRSCLTCLQTRSSKGVFCWCFITSFFAAKLLLLWHISVAYFSTFAPPCGEFLHTEPVYHNRDYLFLFYVVSFASISSIVSIFFHHWFSTRGYPREKSALLNKKSPQKRFLFGHLKKMLYICSHNCKLFVMPTLTKEQIEYFMQMSIDIMKGSVQESRDDGKVSPYVGAVSVISPS